MFFLSKFTEACNFPDDTTFYTCDMDWNILIKRLEHGSFLDIEWFENNNMKLKHDKCHLLVFGNKNENVWAHIGTWKIGESNKRKLLGLDIDRSLINMIWCVWIWIYFIECVSSFCRKAGKKLIRLSNFMSLKYKHILLKTFIESEFGYFLLIWLFYSRRVNNKNSHLCEFSLPVVCRGNYKSYVDLLAKNKSLTIH